MLGLLTTIAPLAVRIITMLLDRKGASDAEKQQFIDSVEKFVSKPSTPAALKSSYRAQKDRLEAEKQKPQQEEK